MAVDGNFESGAHLSHSLAAQSAEPVDEYSDRDALDRVKIDRREVGNRIGAWFEEDLAGEVSDRRRARGNERAPQSGYGCISREDQDGPAANVRKLAPPKLPSTRHAGHVAAAERKDARSPHTSGALIGSSS